MARLTIVPPWFLNAWIMVPSGSAVLGLLFLSGYSATRAVKRKREADTLREQLLQEEHQARETLQVK